VAQSRRVIAGQRAVCRALMLGVLVSFVAMRLDAQEKRPAWPLSIDPAGATTGSPDEQSLLLLQLTGRAPMIHTTIRSFSARALDTLVSWERPDALRGTRGTFRWSWMRPEVAAWFNSNLPSETDGVVWAGRGLTGAVRFGGKGRSGPISFALRPTAFLSQNRAFTPPLGVVNPFAAPPPYDIVIDLPYRFGDKSYGRFDLGESWLQLDTRYVAAGASTATQAWGPMHIYPLLLGPNAGGFPHVFAGSGLPLNVGIGRVSGRMAIGRLDPSAFAPEHPGDRRRLASELAAVFSPRGLDGLEIGAGRFFHRRWPTDGLTSGVLTIPLEGLLKERLNNKDSEDAVEDNQLASVFFRLVVPKAGTEIYGELLRDDHSYDIADLIGEPDHESAYALGLRHVWGARSAQDPLSSVTLEVVNGRISQISRLRSTSAMYVHGQVVEGHTQRGKLLGSPAAFGGSGYALNWERRTAARGWNATLRSERLAQDTEAGIWRQRHSGFRTLELSRLQATDAGEWTVGTRAQIGWGLSPVSSLGLFVGYRFLRAQ
jgi:hypothetical protein